MQRLNQYRLVGHATFGRNRKAKHYSSHLLELDATETADLNTLAALARQAMEADKVKTEGVMAVMRYDIERRSDGIDIVEGFGRAPVLVLE